MKTNDKTTQASLARAGLPTSEEVAQRDKRARESRAAADKTAARHEEYMRKHAPPPALSQDKRRESAIRGLARMLDRERREDVRSKIEKQMHLAQEALRSYMDATAKYAELPNPQETIRAAAAKIAERLQKAIGGFDSATEAQEFVMRTWPLTSAKAAAAKEESVKNGISIRANDAQKKFWAAIELAACFATGKMSNEAIDAIIKTGSI